MDTDLEAQLQCAIEREDSYEGPEHRIPLGVYGLVFTPHLCVNAFLDVNAKLSTNLRTKRKTRQQFTFTKRAGQTPIFHVSTPSGEDNGTSSQLDLTCEGEFSFGWQGVLDMNVLRETVGGRLKLKAGPSFQSEVGLGVLAQASRNYQPEIYGFAKLDACLKIGVEGTAYQRNLIWGTETEQALFLYEFSSLQRKIDLFPRFFQTRAAHNIVSGSKEVDMTTKTDNDILTNVEAGFQIVDANDNIVDSVFVDSIYAGRMEVQGLADTLALKTQTAEVKTLRVRPVFHYAGYTVPAQFTSILSDPNIQPVIFGFSNGSTTVVSGPPYTGYAKTAETTYLAGPYIPIPQPDSVFNTKPDISQGIYIDIERNGLAGVWMGQEGGQDVTYTFNENETGVLEMSAQTIWFTYQVNSPQSGRITLYFDEDNKTKVLYVIQLGGSMMRYKTAPEGEVFILEKQYL